MLLPSANHHLPGHGRQRSVSRLAPKLGRDTIANHPSARMDAACYGSWSPMPAHPFPISHFRRTVYTRCHLIDSRCRTTAASHPVYPAYPAYSCEWRPPKRRLSAPTLRYRIGSGSSHGSCFFCTCGMLTAIARGLSLSRSW